MSRFATALLALLIAFAAPARAWCEASCLLPVQQSESAKPHCPAHEPATNSPAISANDAADCPAVELPRPVTAKIVFVPPVSPAIERLSPQQTRTSPREHVRAATPRLSIDLPLRI